VKLIIEPKLININIASYSNQNVITKKLYNTYSIDNKTVVTTDSTKDLEITIMQSLAWDSHYKVISSKAYKILGLIRHSFSSSGPVLSRCKLYISLVRSQVLYCSPIWRPCLIKYINMLERIQRLAKKWILNDYQLSYRFRLMSLCLLPLMYIYKLNDIIFIKSHKQPTSHFNINEYIKFSASSTRSGSSNKWFITDVFLTFSRTFTVIVCRSCGTPYHK